ncbi:hypothetical protein PC9H_002705 [Pleurotus ostreatus]|uniref:Uncharacterized protein n=1 Tax=Pleurotus ostreatus TaxID=5322 RepID=A0A8H6ZK99_PLEOS|nr:uncharacterized protein PC9H_002705 [Pleurotus ostreatus]KAF7416439.1 hypothetical protein PC9H_002705 [Pleurotus ostreatus]KAJ8689359.1 hypothetical protein PTI98_013384 [Pleurotus ostreatus]
MKFTDAKEKFLAENLEAYGIADHLGQTTVFMNRFFDRWVERFHEMEYLTADSDVQRFVRRRMQALIEKKLQDVLTTKSADELSQLKANSEDPPSPPHGKPEPFIPRYHPLGAALYMGPLRRDLLAAKLKKKAQRNLKSRSPHGDSKQTIKPSHCDFSSPALALADNK